MPKMPATDPPGLAGLVPLPAARKLTRKYYINNKTNKNKNDNNDINITIKNNSNTNKSNAQK